MIERQCVSVFSKVQKAVDVCIKMNQIQSRKVQEKVF